MRGSISDREKTALLKEAYSGSPPGHGYLHAIRVARIARKIAKNEGLSKKHQKLSWFLGIVHDIDHRTGSQKLERLLASFSFSTSEKESILDIVSRHSDLPKEGDEILLKVLRDADRLSRLGPKGLVSLLEINQGAGRPFCIQGESLKWEFDTPLVPKADIKSCVSDIRACLSWWRILETKSGKRIFLQTYRFNLNFLASVARSIDRDGVYGFWRDQIGAK